MSCKYYYMDGYDYHCGKCDKDVNSDWYYKYCRNWDYDDCPVYRGKMSEPAGTDSDCFLTSACTAARGLPDDCHELTVLRNFRDNWLKNQPEGVLLIAHYYEVAPKIVEAIDKLENRLEIWDEVYQGMVVPCMEMIEKGRCQEALELYRGMTGKLEWRFIV